MFLSRFADIEDPCFLISGFLKTGNLLYPPNKATPGRGLSGYDRDRVERAKGGQHDVFRPSETKQFQESGLFLYSFTLPKQRNVTSPNYSQTSSMD